MRQAFGMKPASEIRAISGVAARSTKLTVLALVAAAATIVWAAVGGGYFWPMWVWFGIAIALSLELGLAWAWAQPRGRRRQLAVHGVVSAILVAIDLTIWAMSGGGFFWPVFPTIALGGAFAVHAKLRWQQDDLAARVEQLTRTRRGALDVQGAELRRIERDLHDGAQARLVALSIQLGRAEERLEGQPEAAELVRRAREEATAAIGELRDLARGIAPPVLADRGPRGGGAGTRRSLAGEGHGPDRRAPAAGARGRDRRLLRRRRGVDQRRQARPRRHRPDHDPREGAVARRDGQR
jgi:signal transduction histidine kinase